MPDPTLADAILDKLVNNAHQVQLIGKSMRKATDNANWPANPLKDCNQFE